MKKKKCKNWRITQKSMTTYTKRLVTIVIGLSLIDLQLCFIMPFFDKTVPETLGIAIATEIVGVCFGYFLKSFKETNAEQNIKLERDKLSISDEDISSQTDISDTTDIIYDDSIKMQENSNE